MPAAKPPPAPPAPAAAKVVAILGWYCLVGLLLWRSEVSAQHAIALGGAPLAFVLGFKVSDLLKLLIKR